MIAQLLDPSGPFVAVARRLATRMGLKIQRCPADSTGIDAFHDMGSRLDGEGVPLIIDVGANVGQSVRRFKAILPRGEIHSFEPSPSTYAELVKNVGRYSGVQTSNFALGASVGESTLLENVHSDMSSFLPPGPLAWGHVTRQTRVPVTTLDSYSEAHGLGPIHILKTDTQGFDFEVVRGAEELLRRRQIQMVYMEVIFSEMYDGVPPYDEIFAFMRNQGFKLVSLYEVHHQEGLASWTDALFINPTFTSSE